MVGSLYKHKVSGEHLRLLKVRDSNINTYLQVNSNNIPITKKRAWSVRNQEQQRRLVKGFDKLERFVSVIQRNLPNTQRRRPKAPYMRLT